MADTFPDEIDFIFVKAPLTVAQLRALVEGIESSADTHPVDPTFPTNAAVTRVFDGVEAGTPGYVITYGPQNDATPPILVEVVSGKDDAEKIEAARLRIGRGGEFIGWSDFAAGAATESAIVFRRATAEPPPLSGTTPSGPWLDRVKSLPQTVVSDLAFKGLARDGLRTLPDGVILMTTDADIDTDGPGGSKAKDPTWGKSTSLEVSDGVGCDSRVFPGVVLPPAIRERLGARTGDFGVVFFKDRMAACQVYDSGPPRRSARSASRSRGRWASRPSPADSDVRRARCRGVARGAQRQQRARPRHGDLPKIR